MHLPLCNFFFIFTQNKNLKLKKIIIFCFYLCYWKMGGSCSDGKKQNIISLERLIFLTENIHGQTNCAKRRVFPPHSNSPQQSATSHPQAHDGCDTYAARTWEWVASGERCPAGCHDCWVPTGTSSPSIWHWAMRRRDGTTTSPLGSLHCELLTAAPGGFAAQQALSSSTCVRRVGRSLIIPLGKDLHDLTYLAHKKSIPHRLDGIC